MYPTENIANHFSLADSLQMLNTQARFEILLSESIVEYLHAEFRSAPLQLTEQSGPVYNTGKKGSSLGLQN